MKTNMNKEKEFSTTESNGSRKFKNDIIFIGSLLLIISIAALAMLLSRTEGDTVTVTVDGQLFGEYSLNENKTVEIKSGNGYNILVIEDGRAIIASASCPDGICAAHRPVGHNGESIICLPNKVVVEVRAQDKNQPDIIT